MALWSLFVEVGDTRYSTQVTADDPRSAMRRLMTSGGLKQVLARLGKEGWPPRFSARDIVLLIPMDGLVNMYLCQFGRSGKYVSVVLARTVARKLGVPPIPRASL